MFRRPINSTEPAYVVHDKSTSNGPIFPFSSSLGASLHPRHQSLSLAPKSNDIYDQDDQDDDNASIEATVGDGYYQLSSDYNDRLRAVRAYKADIQAEAAMLTANFVREQQHLKVTPGRPASYIAGLDNSSSNYEDKVRDATSYQVNIAGEPIKLTADRLREQQHVEAASGRHASYFAGSNDCLSKYEDKLGDATAYEAGTPGEPVELPSYLLRRRHVEVTSGRRASYIASLDNWSSIAGRVEVTTDNNNLLWLLPRDGHNELLWPLPRDRHNEGDRLRRRGNPYASTLNTKPRENRRKVLRVRINNEDHLACPDSGSEKNIISKACAVEHGFRIRRKAKDKKRFEVGNGDIVWSIGRVLEIVRIPGSPLWQKKRWFYVLENCPVPLVMGMKFLREAEILTKYRHLLENCPTEMCNISSLLWIGSPRNRLRCTIDGRQLVAAADTGSDLNLMSLACAEREGFRIDRRMEARTQIVVGSGKVIETLGQVYVSNLTLDWREPEADHPEQSPHTPENNVPPEPDPHGSAHPPHGEGDDDLYIPFHVVEDLPCDIVFGHKFLHDTDAFNKCPELLDIPPTKRNRHFEKHKQQFEFMIFRSKILPHISFFKKPKLVVDVEERHESDWHAERHRRSKNTEEKIALLPPGDRAAARRSEAKKVRDWNTAHASCQSCNTGSAT